MMCHSRKPPTTTHVGGAERAPPSTGSTRRIRLPSSLVQPPQRDQRDDRWRRIASTIAASFKAVGDGGEPGVDDRRHATALAAPGPVRSVKTPTICGPQVGVGETGVLVGAVGFAQPDGFADQYLPPGVIRCAGSPGTRPVARGTPATTTLRSVMSTPAARRTATKSSHCSDGWALLFWGAGAEHQHRRRGGIDRMTSQGTVAVIDTGGQWRSAAATTSSSCPAVGESVSPWSAPPAATVVWRPRARSRSARRSSPPNAWTS